jgi:hypothetical protein
LCKGEEGGGRRGEEDGGGVEVGLKEGGRRGEEEGRKISTCPKVRHVEARSLPQSTQ